MVKLRIVAAFVVAVVLGGCGTEEGAVMPDVVGAQLDVALSDIERAGFTEDVEVLGGGTFGVVKKSNWQVCEQLPDAGETLTEAPRLTVDRSCEESEPESQEGEETDTTTTASTTTAAPTTTTAEVLENLTAENSPDLAALLTVGDNCSDSVEAFAANSGGRTIEFDGNIATMNNHEGRDTRFDILVTPGDYSETSQVGPTFQFRDVAIQDLNLNGDNIPEHVKAGQNYRFIAEVGEYDDMSCLFFLRPVATQVR